jgi:hypothetical protein
MQMTLCYWLRKEWCCRASLIRRSEIEIPYEMETNTEKLEAAIPNTVHDRSKRTGECRMLKIF